MKINNKFFWIKTAVIGLTIFSATAEASKMVGLSLNPNVEIASRVSPAVQGGLIRGGNALWNSEINQENKDFYAVNFQDQDDFAEIDYITQTQEVDKLEKILAERCKSWEVE